MRVVLDVEANGLKNPTKIWVVVCKDIDTKEVNIFRRLTDDVQEKIRFIQYIGKADRLVGHNLLGYDYPVLSKLLDLDVSNIHERSIDTLIISKLVNYSRPQGHSIEAYGEEFNYPKGDNKGQEFFSKWSQELEDYCVRDVEICERIYHRYLSHISNPSWLPSIILEHRFQLICNDLSTNGFGFNSGKAQKLLDKVAAELEELDQKILVAFPPREVLIREFTPKETKYGTISKTSVPRSLWPDIHNYEVGKTYRHTKLEPFNPSSHKQIINVLQEAGWCPESKTTTHIQVEREYNRLKRSREPGKEVDLKLLSDKLGTLKISGWKVDETNLSTLPPTAPAPARLLAKRILLEARRRTLVEWLGLVQEDGRIHGKFYGLGAWTHRMAHQEPNTANIPREFKEDGSPKLLGRELRELWWAPSRRLLVGVDAEGIQLRIFAHYINDAEFTQSLVEGKKDDKTDPHSLNQRVLGNICKTRQAAKRFIYALLLGAGLSKLSQILECSETECKEALSRLLHRYTGFARLKKEIIPEDGKRGSFIGLDGRKVYIPGETQRDREHLCMSGYLQNGEAVVIKQAAILIDDALHEEKELGEWGFVDIVHDELQSETKNDLALAHRVAEIKANAIKQAGEILKLRCPMAGSYWADDRKQYTIGKNWYVTH